MYIKIVVKHKMSSFVLTFLILVAKIVPLLNAQGTSRRTPCEPNTCKNGAKCVFPADYPICQCRSGFGGKYCENIVKVKPGECAPNNEPDKGTCVQSCDGDFDCAGSQKCCPTFCQRTCVDITKDPCNRFCLNGGRCIFILSAPRCRCPDGFSGIKCENKRESVHSGNCPRTTANRSACRGAICKNDYDCPQTQKCCPGCGNRCINPVNTSQEVFCGNTKCTHGQICVQKQRPCPPGRLCIQALTPTCVPAGCTKCGTNENCRPNRAGYRCYPF